MDEEYCANKDYKDAVYDFYVDMRLRTEYERDFRRVTRLALSEL